MKIDRVAAGRRLYSGDGNERITARCSKAGKCLKAA